MEITAAMVKELRERTQAGMMDCKKALVENQGDMEKAIAYLREKGLAAAAKKAEEPVIEVTVEKEAEEAPAAEAPAEEKGECPCSAGEEAPKE